MNNQLLVFGGADRTSRTYEDLWALSLGGCEHLLQQYRRSLLQGAH